MECQMFTCKHPATTTLVNLHGIETRTCKGCAALYLRRNPDTLRELIPIVGIQRVFNAMNK